TVPATRSRRLRKPKPAQRFGKLIPNPPVQRLEGAEGQELRLRASSAVAFAFMIAGQGGTCDRLSCSWQDAYRIGQGLQSGPARRGARKKWAGTQEKLSWERHG